MSHVHSLFFRIWTSLCFDFELVFKNPNISLADKFSLIFQKYLILTKYFAGLYSFRFGESHVILFGRPLFYEQADGITRFQSILCRHMQALREVSCLKDPVVVDIGANVGYFTRAIAIEHPNAKIIAIEPVPVVVNVLRQNLEDLKDRVTILPIALGSKDEVVRMDVDLELLAESRVSDKSAQGTRVDQRRLDDALKDLNSAIDLIKIDVEGYECEVLRGASETLARTRFVLMEYGLMAKESFTKTSGLLSGPGFDFDIRALILYKDPRSLSKYRFDLADVLLENKMFDGPHD